MQVAQTLVRLHLVPDQHLLTTGYRNPSGPSAADVCLLLFLVWVVDESLAVGALMHVRHKGYIVVRVLRPLLGSELLAGVEVFAAERLAVAVDLKLGDGGGVGDARIGVGRRVVDHRHDVGDLEVLAVAELGEHLLVARCELEVVVVDAEECEGTLVAAYGKALAVGGPREGGTFEVYVRLVDVRRLELITEEKGEVRRLLLGVDEPEEDDTLVAHGEHYATVERVEVTDGELSLELCAGDRVGALVPYHCVGAHVLQLELTLVLLRSLAGVHAPLDLLRQRKEDEVGVAALRKRVHAVLLVLAV